MEFDVNSGVDNVDRSKSLEAVKHFINRSKKLRVLKLDHIESVNYE